MDKRKRSQRISREFQKSEVNLVTARSALSEEASSYSRNARQGGYAEQRLKRTRKRRILTSVTVILVALLFTGVGTAFGLMTYLNHQLQGGLDLEALNSVLKDRVAPEDPFWMLLVGTDWDPEGGETFRSDVVMLAHIDPGNKQAALVSIPRDTMVSSPEYGRVKINATFTYGEMDPDSSGPEYLIKAVSNLTGVDVSGYAQVNFEGLAGVVDALGGVSVVVPLDIIGDTEAGPVDVYAGEQVLNGQSALVFVRSRQYGIGDFQRQANQRTLLQAIAKQVLSEDPVTIGVTVGEIANMTSTNLNVQDIVDIATSLRGMQESSIYTYSLPSENEMVDGISYVVVDEYAAKQLIADIDKGVYPDYSDQSYQGETDQRYHAEGASTGNLPVVTANFDTSQYLVVVRNGYGVAGAAIAVSDLLGLVGYQQGEVGNVNSYVYEETLIIYRDDTDREAAEDIHARIACGRVIPSLGRYSFEGNILVVVGGDFKQDNSSM